MLKSSPSEKNEETSTKNDKSLSTMNSGISTQEPRKEEMHLKVVQEADKYTDIIISEARSHNVEKKVISKIIELENRPTHLLDMEWSYDYADYLRNGEPKLRPIDNTHLRTLIDAKKASPENHYVIVDELIWLIIMNLYGGGPEIIALDEKGTNFEVINVKKEAKYAALKGSMKMIEKIEKPMVKEEKIERSEQKSENEEKDKEQKVETEKTEEKNEKAEEKNEKVERFESKKPEKERKRVSLSNYIVGISNNSYYCFINTALQCLLSFQTLNEYFLQEKYSQINYKTKKSLKYTHAYQSLISEITENSRYEYISASNFKKMFKKNFSPYEMHDSQEFLRFLLSELQDEMNPPIPTKIVKKFQLADFPNTTEAWEFYQKYHPSIIDELFAGQLVSEIVCPHCGKVSNAYDPFLDLSLTISKSTGTIYECLELFCKKEAVEQYQCEGCKKKSKAYKSLKISVEPKILVIHFKRFKIYPRKMKLTERVAYPVTELKLDKYLKNSIDFFFFFFF